MTVTEPDGSSRTLFDNLEASFPSGLISAIVGASGSGKSTLLRAMCRLVDLSRGTVEFDGIDIASLPVRELRRRVTFIPQTPTALTVTVMEEVRVGNPALTDDEARELLGEVGIERLRDYETRRLSGGELQRLCFARALAIEPDYVLADESTASLDEQSKRLVEDALGSAAARGVGVVLVTHDLDQVDRIAGACLYIGDQRPDQSGRCDERGEGR
jgi:ABC-type multidrug transport system fused ATPase/permease subunit